MDVPSSSSGKKKAKQDDTRREPNWTVEETAHLLNAVQQIQTSRSRVGFNFKPSEQSDIYSKFKDALPHTTRERGKIINRTKVLLKMFKVCLELSNRSGGGWDDDNHRPIAPSQAEYVEMIMAKGENRRFLLTKNFPWFRQMEKMVGGQSSRGEIRRRTYGAEEPIHSNLDSQMPIHVSEQGSSDDADEGDHRDGEYDSGQTPVRDGEYDSGQPPVRNVGRQSSDASFTKTNGNSGSKRKSTDESSEPSSKGKRYKERYQAKRVEQINLAKAGFELARVFEKNTIWKMTVSEEEDKCLERFDEWGLVGRYHDFCMLQMKDNDARRKWFLRKDKHAVIEWIEEHLGSSTNYVPNPTPNNYVPNPTPNNYVPNQSYSQPNPAFNYHFINPNP